MKIFIDGSTRKAVNRMFPVWESMGHSIIQNISDADVRLAIVKIEIKSKIPTILRLDGVYYDLDDNYKKLNTEISRSHKIANGLVYQSYLSKRMCEKYLAKRNTEIVDIIPNGIDDWNSFEKHEGINVVSCSKWRRPKRLEEIIEVFKIFNFKYPNAKLHILGPMRRGSKDIKHNNVIYHGRVNEDQIKTLYKTCDIYLHLCKRDSCPSSVLESISCGVPIVTTNICGGATEMCSITDGCEIVFEDKESLEPDRIYRDSSNKLQNKVKLNIVDSMIKIINNKTRVKLPDPLHIKRVAKRYIKLMEKII